MQLLPPASYSCHADAIMFPPSHWELKKQFWLSFAFVQYLIIVMWKMANLPSQTLLMASSCIHSHVNTVRLLPWPHPVSIHMSTLTDYSHGLILHLFTCQHCWLSWSYTWKQTVHSECVGSHSEPSSDMPSNLVFASLTNLFCDIWALQFAFCCSDKHCEQK